MNYQVGTGFTLVGAFVPIFNFSVVLHVTIRTIPSGFG